MLKWVRFFKMQAMAMFLALIFLSKAHAAPPMEPAEALFREAEKLATEGQFDKACPLFAQSLSLSRKPGTLHALGDCFDHQGRIASASQRFQEYIAEVEQLPLDRQEIHKERKELAAQRILEISSRIPTVTLSLPEGVIQSQEVILDDVPVKAESFGVLIPLDPGPHLVVIMFEGKVRRKERFHLQESQHRQIQLWAPIAQPAEPKKAPPTPRQEQANSNPLRMAGFITLGVGGAGVILGVVAGGLALSKKQEMLRSCTPLANEVMRCYTMNSLNAGNDSNQFGNVSTASLAIGIPAAVAGLVMIAVDERRRNLPKNIQDVLNVSFLPTVHGVGGQIAFFGQW